MMKTLLDADIERIKLGHAGAWQRVYYKEYQHNAPIGPEGNIPMPPFFDKVEDNTTAWNELKSFACYASLKNELKYDNSLNRVYTEMRTDDFQPNGPEVTLEESRWWIDACKEHGLLPSYVNTYYAVSASLKRIRMVLDVKDIKAPILYLYLTSLRDLREHRGFVKAMYYLVKECGVDFYIAYVLASHFNIASRGHHSMDVVNSSYSGSKPVPKELTEKFNMRYVCGLFRMVNCPEALQAMDSIAAAPEYNCDNTMKNLCAETSVVIPVADVLRPDVVEIAHTRTDKEMKAAYKLYQKNIKQEKGGKAGKVAEKIKAALKK